jgi:hypothetical protein
MPGAKNLGEPAAGQVTLREALQELCGPGPRAEGPGSTALYQPRCLDYKPRAA